MPPLTIDEIKQKAKVLETVGASEEDISEYVETALDELQSGQRTPMQKLAGSASDIVSKVGMGTATAPISAPLPGVPLPEQFKPIPIMEKAGETVERRVEDVAGKVAEAGYPTAATGMSLVGSMGSLKPSNVAMQVGGSAVGELPIPGISKTVPEVVQNVGRRVDDFLGVPTIKRRLDKFVQRSRGLLGKKTRIEPKVAEEAGEAVVQNYEKTVTPLLEKADTNYEQAKNLAKETAETGFEQAKTQAKIEAESAFKAKEGRVAGALTEATRRYGPETTGFQEAGSKVQSSYARMVENIRKIADRLYNKLGELTKDVPVSNDSSTHQFIEDVFGEAGISFQGSGREMRKVFGEAAEELFKKYQPRQLVQMAEQMQISGGKVGVESGLPTTDMRAYQVMGDVLDALRDPNLTVKQLMQMRTDIGRVAFQGADNPVKGVLKGVYRTLTEDIEKEGIKGGFGGLAKSASSVWKKFRDLERSSFGGVMEADPGDVVLKLESATSPDKVQMLMKTVEPEARDSFRASLLGEIIRKADGNPRSIYQQLHKWTPEVKAAIFGSDAPLIFRVERFAKIVSDSAPEIAKVAKPKVGEMAKPQVLSQAENKIRDLMQRSDYSKVIENVIGTGEDVGRIVSAFRFLDDEGRMVFRQGLIDRMAKNPELVTKMDSRVIRAIWGEEDSAVIEAFKSIVSARDSMMKRGFVYDAAETLSMWSPVRLWQGIRGLGEKFATPGMIRRVGAEKVFPEALGKPGVIRRGVKGLTSPTVTKTAIRGTVITEPLRENNR